MMKSVLLTAALAAAALPAARAAELVYRPVNPSFGGRALNGSFLLGAAQAQNDFEDPDRRVRDDSLQAQFVSALQSRLLGGLANQVSEAIFGENANPSGQIVFDDLTINYSRGLQAISVEIIDANSGGATLIEVPTLQLN